MFWDSFAYSAKQRRFLLTNIDFPTWIRIDEMIIALSKMSWINVNVRLGTAKTCRDGWIGYQTQLETEKQTHLAPKQCPLDPAARQRKDSSPGRSRFSFSSTITARRIVARPLVQTKHCASYSLYFARLSFAALNLGFASQEFSFGGTASQFVGFAPLFYTIWHAFLKSS